MNTSVLAMGDCKQFLSSIDGKLGQACYANFLAYYAILEVLFFKNPIMLLHLLLLLTFCSKKFILATYKKSHDRIAT